MLKINKPGFLVNKNKCLRNIEAMAGRAARAGANFRPHFKTHRSAVIADWFRDFGINSITVSSVSMAGYFASNGWKDITIAMPVNILEIKEIAELAEKISLNLIVAGSSAIESLDRNISTRTGVFIEIDAGYHRTGLEYNDIENISRCMELLKKSKNLVFKGFLSHFGNTYSASGRQEIIDIYNNSVNRLTELKNSLPDSNNIMLSIGDTPSCSVVPDLSAADEIRPGNFVFYDLMQMLIGSCSFGQIAAIEACPVIYKNKARREIVIYGGAVHLSKEYVTENKRQIYGKIVSIDGDRWSGPLEGAYVKSLSQEHGIIHCPDEYFDDINEGSVLGVVPVHSCLSAGLSPYYISTDGQKLEKMPGETEWAL